MKKALFIVGPTAVGKTALAVKLSKKIPSVLIGADSIQVIRGADIISGKDHPKGSKIFLIDAVSPTENFSVSDFVKDAEPIIKKAINDRKIPIIVGGTGFYAEALFKTFDTMDIPPKMKLRKSLEGKSLETLQKTLKKISPKRFEYMNFSDAQNKRRLIRAIEVAGSTIHTRKPIFDAKEILIVGLTSSEDELRKRIILRVNQRIKQGALKEARALFKNYKSMSSKLKTANGYKQLFKYLLGSISLDEAQEEWIASEYHHVKKQMTWFRRNRDIVWFDIENQGFENGVLNLVKLNFQF